MNIVKKVFSKNVRAVLVSYAMIYVVAAAALMIQLQTDGEVDDGEPWTDLPSWILIEAIAIPILYLVAGRVLTSLWKLEKMKFLRVLIGATIFAVIGFVLCRVSYAVFLVINMPAVSGGSALDRFLRTIHLRGGGMMYEKDYYPEWIFPAVYSVFQILHWIVFWLGNKWEISRRYWKNNK